MSPGQPEAAPAAAADVTGVYALILVFDQTEQRDSTSVRLPPLPPPCAGQTSIRHTLSPL